MIVTTDAKPTNLAEGQAPTRVALSSDGRGEQLLTAHYQATRENMIEMMRNRDRYIYLCMIAVGLILSFALREDANRYVVVIIPFILLITGYLYVHADMTLGVNAKFLATEYNEGVERILGFHVPQWDGSHVADKYMATSIFKGRIRGVSFLLASAGIASVLIKYLSVSDVMSKALADIELGGEPTQSLSALWSSLPKWEAGQLVVMAIVSFMAWRSVARSSSIRQRIVRD